MDDDDPGVFRRTVDWALDRGITTATFHIQTPYPGTRLFARMAAQDRLVTRNWDLYDTRHVVFRPAGLTAGQLKDGYDWAYEEFYRWSSIARASLTHARVKHQAKHFFYAAGWKKFEPLWNLVIRARQLRYMTPVLEAVLSKISRADLKACDVMPSANDTSPELPPDRYAWQANRDVVASVTGSSSITSRRC
jgi:hypothetical protein